MVLGMSPSVFTLFHVVLSLAGILTGCVVVFGMFASKCPTGWTAIFLAATVLTSLTGFLFPFDHLLPSHLVGIVSMIVLCAAVLALYVFRLAGSWRWIYLAGAVSAFYLNVFVLVAQAFAKLSFLHQMAPTQTEPPFAIAQGVVFAIFVTLFINVFHSFHPGANAAASSPA